MSDDILADAGNKLADLAFAAVNEMRSNGTYWEHQANNETYRVGVAEAVGGHVGEFASVLTPGFALAVAAWLQSLSGVPVREDGPLADEYVHAFKAAREVLGEAS